MDRIRFDTCAHCGLSICETRVKSLFKWKEGSSLEEIVDTSFLTSEDPKSKFLGFVRISLFITALYRGIWIFGFHVAVPVGVFLYLLTLVGVAGWIGSSIAGLAFVVLIIGVFDWALHVPRHETLLSGFLP
jgi:hypothetical protein